MSMHEVDRIRAHTAPDILEKIDREIEGLERERDKQQGMVREYDTRIEQLKDKRREWTESEAAD